jgi:hypothetical protein
MEPHAGVSILVPKLEVTTQVTGTFSSKGEFGLEIQVQFKPISAGHLPTKQVQSEYQLKWRK